MLHRERTHHMAGKTKPKKKQPLDTRSKMYLVLALCSVMLLVCIGISLALIGWLPFGGYVELPYTGTAPAVGYALLAADGKGGVRTAASGGRSCLVVHVDTAEKKIGLFL